MITAYFSYQKLDTTKVSVIPNIVGKIYVGNFQNRETVLICLQWLVVDKIQFYWSVMMFDIGTIHIYKV